PIYQPARLAETGGQQTPWFFAACGSAPPFPDRLPAVRKPARVPMPAFRTTRRVPFTPRQMLDLVADVDRYPEFLPLCEGRAVRRRAREGEAEILIADMTVGYKAIRETFTSRVRIDAAGLEVAAAGVPGAMGPFSRLENRWQFRPAPGGGCDVDFSIAYEL